MLGKIYLITNLVNGHRYIGSTGNTLDRRFAEHKRAAKQGCASMLICAAIRKYGEENFKIELLEECETREQAYKRETQLIRDLQTLASLNQGGYNQCEIGSHGPGMTGRKHTQETKHRMSEAKKGKHHSQASREKMSKTRTGQRTPWKWRAVEQLDDQGNVLAHYDNMVDAAEAVGGGHSHIWSCCVGKRKHTHGFAWRYAQT